MDDFRRRNVNLNRVETLFLAVERDLGVACAMAAFADLGVGCRVLDLYCEMDLGNYGDSWKHVDSIS